MIFYPLTFSSLAVLAAIYALLLIGFLVAFHFARRIPGRRLILITVAAVFVPLPLAEEVWVAWRFGQLCQQAGVVISKTVEVDGFYDDTHSWSERRMTEARYRFVEGRDKLDGKDVYWRHERIGSEIRSTRIDKPSARYHFSMPRNNSHVAHKVSMFEYLVVDTKTGEVLAQETTYARNPYWFFVGSENATRFCPISGNEGQNMVASLYNLVLKPVGAH